MNKGIPLEEYLKEHGINLDILEYKHGPTIWNNNTGYIFAMTDQHRIAMLKEIAKRENKELELVLRLKEK